MPIEVGPLQRPDGDDYACAGDWFRAVGHLEYV